MEEIRTLRDMRGMCTGTVERSNFANRFRNSCAARVRGNFVSLAVHRHAGMPWQACARPYRMQLSRHAANQALAIGYAEPAVNTGTKKEKFRESRPRLFM